MGPEDESVESRPVTWSGAPAVLLGGAWGCIVVSALLLAAPPLWLRTLGYLLASIGGLGLVTLYHRASRERIAVRGIASTKTQRAAAGAAAVVAIALAGVYAYVIGWALA